MGCSEVWDDSELDWQAEYSIKLPTAGRRDLQERHRVGVARGYQR